MPAILLPIDPQLLDPDSATLDELPVAALPELDPESESLEDEEDVDAEHAWLFPPGMKLDDS